MKTLQKAAEFNASNDNQVQSISGCILAFILKMLCVDLQSQSPAVNGQSSLCVGSSQVDLSLDICPKAQFVSISPVLLSEEFCFQNTWRTFQLSDILFYPKSWVEMSPFLESWSWCICFGSSSQIYTCSAVFAQRTGKLGIHQSHSVFWWQPRNQNPCWWTSYGIQPIRNSAGFLEF